ncbi:MAG: glycosyltransferase family 2 protein [Pseudomonadota bacterium]
MNLPSVNVVVCVHNALDDVKACLQSVENSQFDQDRLTLTIVDDGSGPETAEYLQAFAARVPLAQVVRRETPGGYTVAANAGLAAQDSDLIALLNSDTIAPPRWLEKITARFAMAPDLGLVGPLSNAASWQSVPERSSPEGGWAINALPRGMGVADVDAVVEEAAKAVPNLVRLPLLNGFCLTIKRAVVETIGPFDEAGFPRGFGEEDDFCLRATNAGFGVALAHDTYVFHAKSKSYGSSRRERLTAEGQEELRRKHGAARLKRAVETMKMNPHLEAMREAVARGLRVR